MDRISPLESAIVPLPIGIKQAITRLPPEVKRDIEEVRLRMGQALRITVRGREREVTDTSGGPVLVTATDLAMTLDLATRSSIHTAMDSMKQGFLTIQGGHRIGLCATAVMKGGEISMLRSISSMSLRVAKEHPGCAKTIFPSLYQGGKFISTIVLSPPGLGKTTVARDIVRLLSENSVRTGVADERGEIAAMQAGRPQFDVGAMTDIMDAAPKSIAMLMLIKTMSPHVICADEITDPADIDAVSVCANCGVGLLVTVHAANVDELKRRPVCRDLLSLGVFRKAVIISMANGIRQYKVTELTP